MSAQVFAFLNACEMAGSGLEAAYKRRLTEAAVQQELMMEHDGTLHKCRICNVSREALNSLPMPTTQK